MFQSWKNRLKAKDIATRILTRGFGLTVIPVVLVLAVIWITNSQANAVSLDGYTRLANEDLNRVVMSLLSACRLYDEDLEEAVIGARSLLNRSGAVHYDSSESIAWQAMNQLTGETTAVRVPLMRVGETAIRPVAEFSTNAPVVDEVAALYKLSSTIFQRIDDKGDMLRISTTVKKVDGSRAIGTYIPAVGTDGNPNPIIRKVLKGETYLGRAFVVNSWYIAAYMPLRDSTGSVIGMIYTGAPEAPVRDKILKFKAFLDTDAATEVFIVHTAGKDHGLFVHSEDPNLQDHVAWNYRDAHGQLYVQDICNRAVSNKGAVSETTYWAQPAPGKPAEKMLVRFVYFPSWDWVIGVEQPEVDFLTTPNRIRRIFLVSNFVPLLVVLVSAIVALIIWNKVAHQITGQVSGVMKDLEQSSEQAAQAIETIRGNADSVGSSAEELSQCTENQASSAREALTTTSVITQAAKRNSQTAERMLLLAKAAETLVGEAERTMEDMTGAMQAILSTNDEALSIIDAINEISFATNIVALNASVEAARAGEAGRTFVFIASEVRELASKVAAAVQETRKIITNSRQQMDRGTDLVGKLNLALNPLNENADQVRKLAGDVTTTSASQAESMEQLLLAMKGMRKSTDQTAQSAKQSTEDASQLRLQIATLAASVTTVDQAAYQLNREFLAAD